MFNFGGNNNQPAFGANNNNQPQFGMNQNTTTGFGTSAFGSQPSTSIFGQPQAAPAFGAPASTSTGFGFGGGGFGANNQAKPASNIFGSTSTQPTTSAFGGFGSSNTGGIFGSNTSTFKPATTTTSVFGSSQPTTSAFGATSSAPAFGSANTGFGSNTTTGGFGFGANNTAGSGWQGAATNDPGANGTGNPPFRTTQETPENGSRPGAAANMMHSISAMPEYMKYSFEELRCRDYELGKKYAGSGATSNAFGATGFGTATNTTGGFGAFGSKPATTSAFGTGAFGSTTTTAAPAFGFGSATTTNTNTGLFGSTTTTSAPLFGSTATTAPSTGFGGFGNTGGNSIFGKPATTAAPSTGFGFGTTATTQASTGFGAFNKPATTTPAFGGFGTSTVPAFGSTTSAPATSGFAATTTTNTGFGGFGTQTTQPSTGLFGSQPATSTGFSFGGGGGTGFGATQPATGGLFSGIGNNAAPTLGFGATTSQPAKPGGFSFGATSTANTGTTTFGTGLGTGLGASTFGTTAPGLGTAGFGFNSSVAPQNALYASIDKLPYGYNPLFNVTTQAQQPPKQPGQQTQPGLVPVTPTSTKKPALTPMYKITPRTSTKVKLRGYASPTVSKSTPSAAAAGHIFDGSSRDDVLLGFSPAGSQFVPRKNIKNLDLSAPDLEDDLPPVGTSGSDKGKNKVDEMFAVNKATLPKAPAFDPEREEAVNSVIDKSGLYTPTKIATPQSVGSTSGRTPSPQRSVTSSPRVISPSEYILSPPMEQLMKYSDKSLKAVEDFTVSVPGVGSIKFLQPVDLIKASPTGDKSGIKLIPGHTIIIKQAMVEVYPEENYEDEQVPPIGFGLNVPAEIELDGCWAIDKVTKKPIKDESDPRFEMRVQFLAEREDTEFRGFHRDTGKWKFRVKHF
ncbi:hypothetical protein HK098_000141 [Nowakowskiella sp. JEL0407]|nr:hypothetical protein HK098_000141 [Nowakowskiella sp. JEL0407]